MAKEYAKNTNPLLIPGELISPGQSITNKRYELSYDEFINPYYRAINAFTVKVSLNGETIDLLSSDSGSLVSEFLSMYGNFKNPMYDRNGSTLIKFESVSFYLEGIVEYLSPPDTHEDTRVVLPSLEWYQKVGSIIMVDMTCEGTTSNSPNVRPIKPVPRKPSPVSKKITWRGGNPRGRKSRGKKSLGRKSRGRKSRGRESRGRKSRGRKSRGRR